MRARNAGSVVVAALIATLSPAATAAPSRDPLRPLQWGLTQVHADSAWRVTRGAGVVVAVIDSGADFSHPDLRGQLLPGKDFTGSGTVVDDCGHGTEVAGVIAARADNGVGIAGIAPRAKVLPLRDGVGCTVNTIAMLKAIRYAVAVHARVINISQGMQPLVGDALFAAQDKQAMQAAVDEAWLRGTLVVAAAGNGDLPICTYPAALNHVICVGAVTNDRTRAYYSQGDATGSLDYVVAPGGGQTTDPSAESGIWTTAAAVGSSTSVGVGGTASGYTSVAGTSFAAPFVSGIAALLFSRGLSIQQVRDRLLSTATDLGPPGRDPVYGYGEIDAAAALR